MTEESANSGCNINDSSRGTIDVRGSVSQYQAPMDTEMAAITRTTVNGKSCVEKREDEGEGYYDLEATYFSTSELRAVGLQLLRSVFARKP